jgi:hypothetical protein
MSLKSELIYIDEQDITDKLKNIRIKVIGALLFSKTAIKNF